MTPRERVEAQVEILDAIARWSEHPSRHPQLRGVISSVDLRLKAVALLVELGVNDG